MKKICWHLLPFLMMIVLANPALAEVSKRPRAGLAYTDYDLEFTSGSGTISSTSYLSVELGLTILSDNLFFDVAYSTSYNAEQNFTQTGQDDDFNRYDFALAAGYLLADHWSVFGGYKYGESEYANYADGVAPNTTLTFETEGFFGGVSKVLPFGQNALSLSASLAILDGKLYDNDIGAPRLNAKADTIGIGLSAAYSIPLQQGMGVVAKLSYQSYDFSNLKDPVYNPDDVTESILNIGAVFYMDF